MALRFGQKLLVGIGTSAGAFVAAAALATGSAAPARADFEDLLDPIVQPILTSLTDSIALFDPAAALDLTSWADTLLASLNSSFEALLPSADSALAAASTSADPVADVASHTLPITMEIGTEPTIQAAIGAGDNSTLLVDTGSSGLVIPWQELGSNNFAALEELFKLGAPENYGFSGYSGGVEYFYLTYDGVPVDYGTDGTDVLTTSPVDVELFSWSTNPANIFENFQSFLASNHVDGILGIGPETAGPTTSPFESYGGVLVDLVGPEKELIVGGANTLTGGTLLDGSPIVGGLTEKVLDSAGHLLNSGTVSNDLDSGGVFGTIPSAIAGSGVAPGSTIEVYNGDTLLYSYVVGAGQAPTVISGSGIDSGVLPFFSHEAYFDYATDKTYWGPLAG